MEEANLKFRWRDIIIPELCGNYYRAGDPRRYDGHFLAALPGMMHPFIMVASGMRNYSASTIWEEMIKL